MHTKMYMDLTPSALVQTMYMHRDAADMVMLEEVPLRMTKVLEYTCRHGPLVF
jgi:hypothetical protein